MEAKVNFLLLLICCTIIEGVEGGTMACMNDEDCMPRKKRDTSDSLYCDTISGMCVDCLVDEACTDPVCDKCDMATHTCVECRDDNDCASPSPFCVAGKCESGCTDVQDCEDFQTCNTTLGMCVCSNEDDPCTDPNESCDANGECKCDAGFVRLDESSTLCIADCPSCGEGEICTRDGKCECGPTTIKVNGECVRCELECQRDFDCKKKGKGLVCNAMFECECPSGMKLFGGRCVPRGHLGGWCKSGHCFGRRVRCNHSTNMCMCRGNCEPYTVCLKVHKHTLWK